MNEIAVSVIVAVYNREKFLDRCIDSLVFQTLENIEIILVDDYSTDTSWECMEKWRERFPEKIKLMKSMEKGVAHAKNTGILAACGKYITIVDSDDYIDYKMLKRMYARAETNDFPEVIYTPIWEVFDGKKSKKGVVMSHETLEDYLKLNAYHLLGKLFRADLFQRFGLLPVLGIGEDSAWFFPILTKIESILYYSTAGYFYERSPQSITLDVVDSKLIEDLLVGSDIVIRDSAPQYAEYALFFSLKRLMIHAQKKPIYQDLFYKYLLDHIEQLKQIEDLDKKDASLARFVQHCEEYCEKIPQIVYINGFEDVEPIMIKESEKVFREVPRVVILDETNCILEDSPEVVRHAYHCGNMEFVGKYFAIKACYENGGVYIDSSIVIDNPFNMLISNPAFFGYESDSAFTDKVFGCCPHNPAFEKILRTYEFPELYEELFVPLSRRIKTVVIGMGNVKMLSQQLNLVEYGFCIYPVEMFVYSLPYDARMSVCHYKTETFSEGEHMQAPQHVLKALSDRRVRIEKAKLNVGKLEKDIKWLKKQQSALKERIEKQQNDNEWLQNQRNILKGRVEKQQNDNEWLQNQRNILKERVEKQQNDNEWLQNQRNILKERVEKQQNDNEWLQNQRNILKERVEKQQNDNEWLQNQRNILKERVEKQQNDNVWLENQRNILKERIAKQKYDNEWLKDKYACSKNKIEQLESEIAEYRSSFVLRVAMKLHRLFSKRKKG